MFFRKKYSFLLNQKKDLLTESLKTEQDKKHVLQTTFSESVYQLKFDYDRWIVSYKHQLLHGLKIKPDASIRLTAVAERITQAEVTIKLSPIWLLTGVFMQLAFILMWFLPIHQSFTFLGKNLGSDWLNRATIVLCNLIFFNLIIWVTFLIETARLKKLIERLFGSGQVF